MSNNSKCHFFFQDIANKIGQDEAILLNQINYWISKCGREIFGYNGKWIYNSLNNWHLEHFNYWSMYRLRKTIKSLEQQNLVKSAKINSKKWNHTKWYAINEEKYNELINGNNKNCASNLKINKTKIITKAIENIADSAVAQIPQILEKKSTNRYAENQQIIISMRILAKLNADSCLT